MSKVKKVDFPNLSQKIINLGATIENRAKEEKPLVSLEEAKRLGNYLIESGKDLLRISKEEVFSKIADEGRLKRFKFIKKFCGFENEEFFSLVCSTNKLAGGAFGFDSEEEMKNFAGYLKQKLLVKILLLRLPQEGYQES